MLVAIVIVFLLLYLFTWSAYAGNILRLTDSGKQALSGIGIVVMVLSLVQILLGTQVREAIDEVIVKLGYGARSEWIDQLGTNFYIHRSFSIILFGANLYWINKIRKAEGTASIPGKIAIACFWILIAEIGTGILMAYFGVPPFAQPLHLTFAILLIGLQFVIWLLVNGKRFLNVPEDYKLGHNRV
jgi:cytochrome c oxidase assembly protein subunit 15